MNRSAGGREIYRGDYNPRTEDISRNRPPRKGEAPPSRHLWVGNLPPRVTQGMLLEHFLRFGDLENIVFVPGRSYAFVNFRRVEEAVFALRSLQGQMFAGLPLKIEFQKLVSSFVLSFSAVFSFDFGFSSGKFHVCFTWESMYSCLSYQYYCDLMILKNGLSAAKTQ